MKGVGAGWSGVVCVGGVGGSGWCQTPSTGL